jgi:hypothetical protein
MTKKAKQRYSPRSQRRSRNDLKAILETALRAQFPKDTVDVSDGYQDNIHVLVVSRRFDGMDERAKQDLLWGIIDTTDLTSDEKALVSLVLPLSPAEIK